MAMTVLGEIHREASRYPDAKKKYTVAKQILEKNSHIDTKLPGMLDIVSGRIEAVSQAPEEKTFFSRFTELARFENEVSGELTVDQRLEELVRLFPYLDDY